MKISKNKEQEDIAGYQRALSELITDRYVSLEKDDGNSQAPVKNNTTFKNLQQRHHNQTMLLSGSKTHMQILDVAHDLFTQPRGLKISNIICLGLGSLSGAVGRCCCATTTPEAEVRANTEVMAQLVFLEEWIEQIRKHFEVPDSAIYFQDPMFNSLDREFLNSLVYTVISSPDSTFILNKETFLFAPFLEDIPLFMSLKTSFPAIYIGASLTGNDPWSINSNPDFQAFIRPFLSRCKKAPQTYVSVISEKEEGRQKLVKVYYPLSDKEEAEHSYSKSLAARGLNILKKGGW